MRGDNCPYAHNVFEYWLHPTRYRTQLCNDMEKCNRKVRPAFPCLLDPNGLQYLHAWDSHMAWCQVACMPSQPSTEAS